jgi:hypothetical protein
MLVTSPTASGTHSFTEGYSAIRRFAEIVHANSELHVMHPADTLDNSAWM